MTTKDDPVTSQPSDDDLAIAKAITAKAMSLLNKGETPSIAEVGDHEAEALKRIGFEDTLKAPRSSPEHSELDAATLKIVHVNRASYLEVR